MKITFPEFNSLMQTVADGWNTGNARKAADCFSEDAIYIEPPEKQLYHGRAELYEFFGGDQGPDIPMKMVWHHLAFNEAEQIGFGEYTFQMHGRYHGIVIVRTEAGLIKGWREYQYKSELNWNEFTRQNSFEAWYCELPPTKRSRSGGDEAIHQSIMRLPRRGTPAPLLAMTIKPKGAQS